MLLILILILVLIIIKLFFNYKKENFNTELPDATIAYEVALIEANAADIANKQAEVSFLSSSSIAKAASAAALASAAISNIATNQANKNKEIADKIVLGNNKEEIDEATAIANISAAVAKSAATASAAANAISKVTANKVITNKSIADKKILESKEANLKVTKLTADKNIEEINSCPILKNGIPDFNCNFGNETSGTSFVLRGWKLVSSVGTYWNEGLSAILSKVPPPLMNNKNNYPRMAGFIKNSVIIGIIGPTAKTLKGFDWYGCANYGSSRNAKNVKLYASNDDFSSNLSAARSGTLLADFTIPQNITTQNYYRIDLNPINAFKAFYFDIIDNYGDSSVKVGSINLDFV
jgi:hypothetical protein